MPHDFDTNHHFTGTQQEEYDSLSARGRSAYDHYRWYDKDSHENAYAQALVAFGHNKVYLMKQAGTWDV